MLLLRVDLSSKAHETIYFYKSMSPKIKTLLERSFSTIVLLSILSVAVYLNSSLGYALLICLFCNMTSFEWYRMQSERLEKSSRGLSLILGLAYPWLASCAVLSTISKDAASSVPELFTIVAIASLAIAAILIICVELYRMDYQARSGAQALSSIAMGLLSFIYPVWLFSFAFVFIEEPTVLLLLIIITKMCDIWAYVCGMLLGGQFFKRRFSPQVSPKKTWEGIIGSFVITSVISYFLVLNCIPAHIFTMGSYIEFLPFMLLIFVLSVTGDLAGSLIKRGLNVKDSGSLLPGIGGIFDLIDSPAFTLSFVASTAGILSIFY